MCTFRQYKGYCHNDMHDLSTEKSRVKLQYEYTTEARIKLVFFLSPKAPNIKNLTHVTKCACSIKNKNHRISKKLQLANLK